MENDMPAKSKDLRNRAEQLLSEGLKGLKDRPVEDIQKVIHELQVHQIELEIQNEELRRTQLELHTERDRYADLYDFAPVGYFTISEKGMIMEANLTGAAMFEVERKSLIHQPFSKFIDRDDEETFYFHRQELIETETRQSCELRLIKKDGSQFHARLECIVIEDAEDSIKGFRAAVIDIEEQKKAEEELRVMEEGLLKIKKFESLSVLAGGIAHQFNNALTAITGHTELLEMDYPQDEKIAEHTKTMKQSAHRMAHLTSQLLAYAGGGKYNPRPISLSEFVTDTLPLISHNLDPAVRVETDLQPDVMNVKADRTQMQMVLSALMANSNEAIEPPGRIRISTRNIDLDQGSIEDYPGLKPGPHVYLSIEDDGKGMDNETKNKLFDPFFTTHFVGRGLGMASVYGIISNHDGSISVDSEPGKGTAVIIYLSAMSAVSKEQGAKAVRQLEVELAIGEGTVLVIEDEEPLLKMNRRILERLGYRVLEAMTGEEAVDLARTFDGRIDLALLDIKLPDMSGNQIYPLIMEARPDLKVIVCSGYSIDGPAHEILDAGAQAFVQKPFLISTLAEKLKEALEGQGEGQGEGRREGRLTKDEGRTERKDRGKDKGRTIDEGRRTNGKEGRLTKDEGIGSSKDD